MCLGFTDTELLLFPASVLQNLLNRLLTVDLPGLMVLPQRLEISIPPSVTSIAEAAVGRDTIMRAVASAVLQVGARYAVVMVVIVVSRWCGGDRVRVGGGVLAHSMTITAEQLVRNIIVWHVRGYVSASPGCSHGAVLTVQVDWHIKAHMVCSACADNARKQSHTVARHRSTTVPHMPLSCHCLFPPAG
jgi:hypothetical protein